MDEDDEFLEFGGYSSRPSVIFWSVVFYATILFLIGYTFVRTVGL